MTKIGNDSTIRIGAQAGTGTASKPEHISFKRAVDRLSASAAASAATPVSGGSAARLAPPSYETVRMVAFSEACNPVLGGGGEPAQRLSGLREGVPVNRMPKVAIVDRQNTATNGPGIVAIGNTIFIPADTFASWVKAGCANAASADAFNTAFSSILAATVTPHS